MALSPGGTVDLMIAADANQKRLHRRNSGGGGGGGNTTTTTTTSDGERHYHRPSFHPSTEATSEPHHAEGGGGGGGLVGNLMKRRKEAGVTHVEFSGGVESGLISPRQRSSFSISEGGDDDYMLSSLTGGSFMAGSLKRRHSGRSASLSIARRANTSDPIPLIVTQRDGTKVLAASDFLHRLNPATPIPSSVTPSPSAGNRSSGGPSTDSVSDANDQSLLQRLAEQPHQQQQGGGGRFSLSSSSRSVMSPSTSGGGKNKPRRDTTSAVTPSGSAIPTASPTSASGMKSRLAVSNERTGKFISPAVGTREVRRKGDAERLFNLLSRHQLSNYCEIESSDTEAIAKVHAKKATVCIDTVFRPACRLLESLWNHFRIGKEEQRRFSERLFQDPSQRNYIQVSNEIMKYTNKVLKSDDILNLVNLRETLLTTLLIRSQSNHLLEATKQVMQENAVVEIFNTILLLRHTTCQIVDLVYKMRAEDRKIKPLLWEGINYLIKMQEDLGPLADTYLPLLVPNLTFGGNPMLLPPKYFGKAPGAVDISVVSSAASPAASPSLSPGGGAGGFNASTRRAMTPSGNVSTNTAKASQQDTSVGGTRSATPGAGAARSSPVALNTSQLGTALSPKNAGGGGVNTSSRISPNGGGGGDFLPRARSSMPVAMKSSVVVVQDGEEIVPTGTPSKRALYFQQKQRDEYIASRKIDMDRSNIFQYPSHVYIPKPIPCWKATGKRLALSLDPATESTPYADRVDYTRMQFGRLQTPPEFTDAMTFENCLIDVNTKGYRPTAPVPPYTFEDLHRRELLIFGENVAMKKSIAQEKLRKGLWKFRIAQKGFFSLLRKNRETQADNQLLANTRRGSGYFRRQSGMPTKEQLEEHASKRQKARGAFQFLAWVEKNAADWLPQIGAELQPLTVGVPGVEPFVPGGPGVTPTARSLSLTPPKSPQEAILAALEEALTEDEEEETDDGDAEYEHDDTWVM